MIRMVPAVKETSTFGRGFFTLRTLFGIKNRIISDLVEGKLWSLFSNRPIRLEGFKDSSEKP